MTTVFVGGSRHVSRLTAPIKERLNSIIEKRHNVVVGDANGADKAVQRHFADAAYEAVTVYCSGGSPRNRLHDWPVQQVTPAKGVKGFQFYAAKDRAMAADADVGLMIWDGKSPGTALNVLRLVQAGKIAVLANVPEKVTRNIKSAEQWRAFLHDCSAEFCGELRDRATAEEWSLSMPVSQLDFPLEPELSPVQDLLDSDTGKPAEPLSLSPAAINATLVEANPASFIDALGKLAKARGMAVVAKDTGLSRESLYRSLSVGGNPEFATVMKVMASLGLRLEVTADGS